MSLRILHVVQRYPPALGGSEHYVRRLSRFLANRGHQVTVWTTNALDLESFWTRSGRTVPSGTSFEDGVTVQRFAIALWPLRRYLLKALSFLPGNTWKCLTMPCNPIATAMWRESNRDLQFDVVHASAFPYAWPIVCARRMARRSGARFFLTPFLHLGRPGAFDRTRRQYLAPHLVSLLASADGVFVQTESEQQAVLGHGILAHRVIHQGMGVDPRECTGGDRSSVRTTWGVNATEVVIGHLANLSVEKGTIDLLLAAQLAWQRGATFRIVLAGADMPNFRRFWQTYPAKENVTVLGTLDDQQKRQFFAGIDAFALPSRSDSFGLVLLEAWANGIPNIAYRCGGVADIIRHEVDGLLVDCEETATPAQVETLSSALVRLVDSSTFRRQLGLAGHERIAREFEWEPKLRLVEQSYRQAVATDPASR